MECKQWSRPWREAKAIDVINQFFAGVGGEDKADPAAREFAAEVNPVKVIADKISALTPPADISLIMQQVEKLLDRSIAPEGYIIADPSRPTGMTT